MCWSLQPRIVIGGLCWLLMTLLGSTWSAFPEDNPFESGPVLKPTGQVDTFVFGRLKQLGIQPAHLCSDAVFVRRAYLDVIGTLPTEPETRTFLSDTNPNKRRNLIDQLLARDEFADYWAMQWSDVLRVKSEFPINLWPNAVQAYHRWIRTSLQENVPYDRFARGLLTASGSNFRVPQVNFYRAVQSKDPQTLAQAAALTFMGVRAESWPKERWSNMAAFFSKVGYKSTSEWKEEIVFFDPWKTNGQAGAQPPRVLTFPDGTKARLAPEQDPREAFADWLVNAKNPWFARAIVNRVWAWLLGRGIIEPPDDIGADKPPSNPALLAYLERELVASHYNLKHLYRLILNSQTYQLSCVPGTDRTEAAANFAAYPLRRLDAEVLIDALDQITGTSEAYSSAIPEPFTFIPEDRRTIELADASITSSFLETFGRPPRDTGLLSERNNRPTAAQRLDLLNASLIQNKLQQSARLQLLLQQAANPRELVNRIYLVTLSRFPTAAEAKVAAAYFQSAGNRRAGAVDLAWALVNSAEFLYRH